MTSVFVSTDAGRALRVDGALQMFDLDALSGFAPRSYELQRFFAEDCIPIAVGDLAAKGEELAINRAASQALDCVLCLLRSDCSARVRGHYLTALEDRLFMPAVGDKVIRRLFSDPLDAEATEVEKVIGLATSGDRRLSLSLLGDIRDKMELAARMHSGIESDLRKTFSEPAASLVLKLIHKCEVVGRAVATSARSILDDLEVSRAVARLLGALPPSIDGGELGRILGPNLLASRQASLPLSTRMTVANRNWGDSRSSSDRSSHKWTPLATSFAHLTHCLFAAGSLGDKTARWARLLDSSLLANPINRQAWNDKLGQLELAGLMAEAVLARSYFDRHLDDITITGHLSLPITPPRFASKAVGPYAGRRDAERIEAEPISPRDLFTLLVTYERSTQTGGGTRGLLELIDQRLRDFVRSEQPSRTAWPMVPVVITAAFTDHYFDGLFARDRMPEALLMSLTTFTDVEEECLGSSRRLFSSLIDDMAKLSEDEYEFFTHQLETSMFYQINHRAIAEVRRKGPSLAVPLLGKLIYFATPGGGGGVLTRDGEFWASY